MFTDEIELRVCEIGEYVVKTQATVRDAAKRFGISKSTVHLDLTERLKKRDYELYLKVCSVLAKNRAERHIRGGMATKEKYGRKRKNR